MSITWAYNENKYTLKNEQMIKWLLAKNEHMWWLYADHYKIYNSTKFKGSVPGDHSSNHLVSFPIITTKWPAILRHLLSMFLPTWRAVCSMFWEIWTTNVQSLPSISVTTKHSAISRCLWNITLLIQTALYLGRHEQWLCNLFPVWQQSIQNNTDTKLTWHLGATTGLYSMVVTMLI